MTDRQRPSPRRASFDLYQPAASRSGENPGTGGVHDTAHVSQLNKSLSDAEVADIVAFFDGLGGEFPEQTMPRLPPTPGDMLE